MNLIITHGLPMLINVIKVVISIDDPYPPDKVKNMNAKIFNLMPWVNEARVLIQLELSETKCGLNGSACNSKQK